MRNTTKSCKTPPPHISLLPRFNFTPRASLSSSSMVLGNGGNGQFIICWLCCFFFLRGGTSHILPSFHMVFLPEETQFSNLSTSQGLSSQTLWVWITWGCSPSGRGFSSMGHQQYHSSWQQTCSIMVSSLQRSISPVRTLLQWVFPWRQPSLGMFLLWTGSSRGCRWFSGPLWTSMCCRDTAASPWTAPWIAEDLTSDAWNTTSSSQLGVCRGFPLTHS